MALLAKLQEEKNEQIAEIWRGILAYANGDTSPKDFGELARLCFARIGVEDAAKVLRACKDLKEASLRELEERYRQPIRDILRWVTRPSVVDPSTDDLEERMGIDANAAIFLTEHVQDLKVAIAFNAAINTEDGSMETRLSRLITESGSVVAGICRFILDQIDRHDFYGEPLAELFPFGLCERDSCGRFFFVQRVGRGRFCSDACRAKAGAARMTKEQNAKRMREYRANLKSMVASKPIRVLKSTTKGRAK